MNCSYKNLALAIVQQACHDYLNSKKKKLLGYKSYGVDSELREIIDFFMDDYFCALCSLNPDYLLRLLDMKAEEEVSRYEKGRDIITV